MPNTTKRTKRSLHLVMFESAITAGLISMSIMTPFFYSIGLNNAEISLSQAIFTVVVSTLNVPSGWLADKLSRKWANVIGDFGCGIVHLLYATVHSFAGVVFCECWLGFFLSLSQGVDFSLLKHFSERLSSEKDAFRRQSARLSCWQQICTLILVLMGGPIGAIDFRLAVGISGAPYLLGSIAAIFIHDDSEKLNSSTSPILDVTRILKTCFIYAKLRWRILAYAVGREMTHGIIWVLTPMLMLAGVPLKIVSLAWALDSTMRLIGARLALRFAVRLKDWQTLGVAAALMSLSMGVLSVNISLWTIGFYGLMGIVCGWTGATLMPLVQESTPPSEQTTVISLAKVVSQILYIPSALVIGWAADCSLRFAPLATLLCFLPLSLIIISKLKRA